ncbi:hypothetical protein H257_00582 [Aphanomyces astaci]|uniref:tetrahydrofolate synthase n=1 Tax=Aphanomyces astaci TaxID=112090 RepID=W4HCB0_APHAT|nr:hypothetical protein H257_00582 [Aphanomyces astaci]ETV89226.1 hypothetical protein H257_00582 [Aphanomyces astaci]|eukprot:XP_009821626.1 hypothetical protein H257_00582 [Aphanomyces astaci]
MALRMFVLEQVDVAILEVGLGGRLDATNVIEKPVVCGIAALDYDHTRILGGTLTKIAREKAGIIKAGVPVFTITQASEAAEVLVACAATEQSPLTVVPSLDTCYYDLIPDVLAMALSMHGQYQQVNAGLAVALASTWLAAKADTPMPPLPDAITPTVLKGLQGTTWIGRAQRVVDPQSGAIFHLDGVHTPLSVACCVTWFKSSVADDLSPPTTLFFNCHHERDIVVLFQPLVGTRFDRVVFCATGTGRASICWDVPLQVAAA